MILLSVVFICSFFLNLGNCDKKVSMCDVCKHVMNHVKKQLLETANRTYEGGMSHTEKNTLGNYESSELRLIEILDGVCSKSNDRSHCNVFVEKNEQHIEEWFFNQRKEDSDFFEFICVNSSKVCCPDHHWGKNCEVCRGWSGEMMCKGHGRCSGDGTRKGTGACDCYTGFQGELCEDCRDGYFKTEDGTCTACHQSCSGACQNETAEGCLGECKKGWTRDDNGVCTDIDECSQRTHNCEQHQYCSNVPGSFVCKNCHESCHTCTGEGDSKCVYCQDGFDKSEDNRCVDSNECTKGMHTCEQNELCVNVKGGFMCKKCHKSCLNGCTSLNSTGCNECKPGFLKDESGNGCIDIDECAAETTPCPEGKYCVNREGTYKCKKCDEACHICHGPGPHSCYSCAKDHEMVNGVCQDPSKIKDDDSSDEL